MKHAPEQVRLLYESGVMKREIERNDNNTIINIPVIWNILSYDMKKA